MDFVPVSMNVRCRFCFLGTSRLFGMASVGGLFGLHQRSPDIIAYKWCFAEVLCSGYVKIPGQESS